MSTDFNKQVYSDWKAGLITREEMLAILATNNDPIERDTPPSNGKGKPERTTGVEIFARQGKEKVSLGTVRQFRQRGGLYWVDKVMICSYMTLQGHDLKAFERNAVTASGKSVGTWRVMPSGKGCVENGINPYEQPQQALDKIKTLDLFNARTAVVLPENGNAKPVKHESVKVSVDVPVPAKPVKSSVPVPARPKNEPETVTISIQDWNRNVYSHLVDRSWVNAGLTAEAQHTAAKTAAAKLAQSGIKLSGKRNELPYSVIINAALDASPALMSSEEVWALAN